MIEIFETPGCISYDGVNNLNAILLISLNYVNCIFLKYFLMNEITINQNL